MIRLAQIDEFDTITEIWEASVRATHDFLPKGDIDWLKPQIRNTWLPLVTVKVFEDCDGRILGFLGVSERKLEMLFLHPQARGQGIGKALLEHAIREMFVTEVDVNEQNPQASGFYQHAGFEVYARSPLDGQGKPYPLLHMRLKTKSQLQSVEALPRR